MKLSRSRSTVLRTSLTHPRFDLGQHLLAAVMDPEYTKALDYCTQVCYRYAC